MSAPVKLAGFAVVLLAVLGLAWGGGALVGPVGAASEPVSHADDDMQAADDTHAGGAAEHDEPAAEEAADELPGGLMISQDGYTLELADAQLPAGPDAALRFQVSGPGGRLLTSYERSHDKDLHLIVVRRDLTAFQHVHPVLDDEGTWSVPVDLTAPGTYRVFADFVPTGHDGSLILGADLLVPGAYEPVALPEPASSTQVDGYTVTLDGDLVAGEESNLTLSVSKDGQPVADLQPYLGAYGHLVALRQGDLAYLHVHPHGHPGDGTTKAGPDITFATTAPSAGTYRLFLDFQHEGVVRTAELTVEVTR